MLPNLDSAIENLSHLATVIDPKFLKSDPKAWRMWGMIHENKLKKLFWHDGYDKLPPVYTLVEPAFHSDTELVMFNYTDAAQRGLYGREHAWTTPLRLCRGIVFDWASGQLVALPFPKFFNYGEHSETRELPTEPFTVTEKLDGHLGIIFTFREQLYVTTRGSFQSKTAELARSMFEEHCRTHSIDLKGLAKIGMRYTLLVEVVHPQTHVHVDYNPDQTGLVMIGAFHIGSATHRILDFTEPTRLRWLSEHFRLPIASNVPFNYFSEVVTAAKDPTRWNQEGWVVRFEGGLYVKVKCETYFKKIEIDRMNSNPYVWVMNRLIANDWERKIETIPEELYDRLHEIKAQIETVIVENLDPQQKWRKLYTIVPEEYDSDYFRGVCRKLVRGGE